MDFWRSALIGNVLGLAVLLAIAAALRTRVAVLRRLAIPDGIVAGALGLVLGPNLADVMPLSGRDLEPLVYHGFAIVFVAVGLQGAERVRATGSARSLSFGFVALAVVQSLLGFALLGIWISATGDTLHPGHGFMIMLGFAQGPGQALAFGSAWEQVGFTNGAQIGLLYAALGFAWCCVLGVPLVAFARRRGWLDPPIDAAPVTTVVDTTVTTGERSGAMEPLTVQIVTIGCVYAAVFGVLWSITRLLPETSNFAASLWGFHFLVGSLLAIVLRKIVDTGRVRIAFDDALLGRIAGTAIDFTTAAALSAIQLDVLGDVLVPILVVSSVGGVLTLVLCVWLTRRAFDEAPFSHMLVLYGTCTGTVPTGLALLRIVDPDLRGPVARSTVIAATAAVPLGMPLFLGVIPLSVAQWSGGSRRRSRSRSVCSRCMRSCSCGSGHAPDRCAGTGRCRRCGRGSPNAPELHETSDCPNVSLVVRALLSTVIASLALGCSGDGSHVGGVDSSTGTSSASPTSSDSDGGVDASTGGTTEDPPVTPAPGGLRRLRAAQYVGTIGVLLGGDAAAVASPPDDASMLGFDAIGSAHVPLSPAAVEQYERSALAIGKAAAAAPYTLSEIAPCVLDEPAGDACFAEVADALGRAAWRRALTDAERERLVAIGSAARELGEGSFELGLAYEIATILQSPAFLYAVELGDEDGALTTDEWVTRLAMLVLGRAPSAQTFVQLDAGMFDGAAAPRELATQWLGQTEARAAMVGLFDELLRLRDVVSLTKDPEQYELFTAELAAAAHTESTMLVEDVLFPAEGAGDLRRLFDADYTFVDAQLAALYGIDAPAADFDRVMLPETRRGILAHASILAVGSHYDRNSPTRRGVLVQRNLLCNDVPPPPGDVDINLPEPPEPTTLRERLEGHLAQGGECVGCHGQTDPIGFAFEHFDASGAWRELDAGFPIDASGDVDGLGTFDGATALALLVRDDPRLAMCMVRNLYRHALGHAEDDGTAALRELLAAELEAADFDMRALVVELVDSDAFLRVGEPK